MVSRGTFYGVMVTFVALLLISSTAAAIYFNEYQQEDSQNRQYVGELSTALVRYRSLADSYNASLSDYGRTLALLASAVANLNTSTPAYQSAAADLSSLWKSYQNLSTFSGRKALAYSVNMLIDFGNGTRRWYNDTSIQPGWNGYVVSLVVLQGNVWASWYPQYGEHFVTGIDGLPQTASKSWFVWEFGRSGWTVSTTGADQIQVNNGTVIAWTLCGYDVNYDPTCVP